MEPYGGYYQVRQLHAHTWVEAYLRPSQIPPKLVHGKDYWPWAQTGGWLQLDPTPAAAEIAQKSGWLDPFRHAMDWLDSGWSKYVVELNAQRQRDAIYQPVVRAMQEMLRKASDRSVWRALFGALLAPLHLDRLSGVSAWLIAAAAGTIAAAILAGAGWLLLRIGRRLRARWAGNHAVRRDRRIEVEFYRRLETFLARQGMIRAASQTQREIRRGGRLAAGTAEGPAAVGLAARHGRRCLLPRPFGRQPLDSLQARRLEHALAELATASRL